MFILIKWKNIYLALSFYSFGISTIVDIPSYCLSPVFILMADLWIRFSMMIFIIFFYF